MNKAYILTQVTIARNRAMQDDVDLQAQRAVITALEHRGMDATTAKALFLKLIDSQDTHLLELEAFLDELDAPERTESAAPEPLALGRA